MFNRMFGRPLKNRMLLRDVMMLLSYRFLLVFILRSRFLNWAPVYIVPYTIAFIVICAMIGRTAFWIVFALMIYDIVKTSTELKQSTGLSFDKRALPRILGGESTAFVGLPFHGALIIACLVLMIGF